MPTASMGAQSQVALSSTASFSSASQAISVVSENVVRQGVILDADEIRGTRARSQERTRTGPYKVGGPVVLYPDVTILDSLLGYILGAGPTSSVYSLAETLPSFYLSIDRIANVFQYGPCYVGKAVFSASSSDPLLKLTLDIEAETETVNSSGSWEGTAQSLKRPYVFSDSVGGITVASTVYSSFLFELTVDNMLLADRFQNSLTRTVIPATDRRIDLKLETAFTSVEASLYGVNVGAFGTASVVFTSAEESNSVLTFTMGGALEYPQQSPNVPGKTSEIHLRIDGTARKSGSTSELTITNSHT
jgi:hypothetical protein